jgi:hypothetical protein
MVSVTRAFWNQEEFKQFVPWLSMRADRGFELRPSAPGHIRRNALAFAGVCVECGRSIEPFRIRSIGNIYLSTSCRSTERPACLRGARASAASEAIEALVRHKPPPPGQGALGL